MNISEYMTFDEDYFGHNLGFHTKKTSCLFDYARQYNEIPWKYAKSVKNTDKISILQIIYALSEITKRYLWHNMINYIYKLGDFEDIFELDEFGRAYISYEKYKAYAFSHKKLFKLANVKKKEVDLWLLRL